MTIGFESSLNIFDFPEIKICLVDDTAATAGSGYVVDLPFSKDVLETPNNSFDVKRSACDSNPFPLVIPPGYFLLLL